MLSTEQKAIIRRICKKQTRSLLRIVEQQSERLFMELREEGYNISFSDIAYEAAKLLEEWDKVREDPERFLQLLDDQNISLIKHHLIQDFLGHEETRPIWRKLNLYDKTYENRN